MRFIPGLMTLAAMSTIPSCASTKLTVDSDRSGVHFEVVFTEKGALKLETGEAPLELSLAPTTAQCPIEVRPKGMKPAAAVKIITWNMAHGGPREVWQGMPEKDGAVRATLFPECWTWVMFYWEAEQKSPQDPGKK